MKLKAIVLCWILLLAPAACIVTGAWRLLRHEQDRIRVQATAAAQDRTSSFASSLQGVVADVQDRLMALMRAVPAERTMDELTRWERANPLVRNVFVFRIGGDVLYPDRVSATREELRFLDRYAALFEGRTPWSAPGGDSVGPAGAEQPAPPQARVKAPPRKGVREASQKLLQLAEGMDRKQSPAASELRGGWMPWYDDSDLFLLGWTEIRGAGTIAGVEIELVCLLSHLLSAFPVSGRDEPMLVLMDGQGRILHQSGGPIIAERAKPLAVASLAPVLPHWQVAMFAPVGSGLAANSAGAFMLLSGLLLALLVLAMLSAGFVLTREAHRNWLDAQQKTSFVSNVSHELKTPLTSIRMYAELLSEGRVRDETKKQRYLDILVAESQRLTRLVNNVLDFSRLEQDRKKYSLETLDMRKALLNVLETQRLRVQGAGLKVTAALGEESVSASADRDALEQVLLNLIDNAVKYACGGGEIAVSLARAGRNVEIRVMDRGPGIPAAHRRRIFEKFHRVDDSLTSRQGGAGLGLSIARGLLRGMGGDLSFEPRPGGGSCFVVRLAAAAGSAT